MPPKKPYDEKEITATSEIEHTSSSEEEGPSPAIVIKRGGKRTVRYHQLSESRSDQDPYIEKLKYTISHFPKFDLTHRGEFTKPAVDKRNIGGRTYKVTAVRQKSDGSEGLSFLIKKNAREAGGDFGSGKTPSNKMDLHKNHKESFREICALRLFQAIFKDVSTTPPEMKVILSEFDPSKVANRGRTNDTKVYIASAQIENLPFDIASLSRDNKGKLQKLEKENPQIIDQLCEQIVVQCILSNADAIKFDNFYVTDQKVFHFDFGDARQNEEFNPDSLCILDQIRNHNDRNASASTRATFDSRNISYANAISYFSKHISPKHILSVIDKLENIKEDLLWHIAYVYTYGDETEKKLYADCLVARVRNFIKLKGSMESLQDCGEEFGRKPENPLLGTSIRDIIAESIEFREEHKEYPIMQCLEAIFEEVDSAMKIDDSDTESQSSRSSHESSSEDKEEIIDLTTFQKKCTDFINICKKLEEAITLPIRAQEDLPDGTGQALKNEVQINEIQHISDRVKKFRKLFISSFEEDETEDEDATRESLSDWANKEYDEIENLCNSFLTHLDAHQEFKLVAEKQYRYEEKKDIEMEELFRSIKIDTSLNPSEDLIKILKKIELSDSKEKPSASRS